MVKSLIPTFYQQYLCCSVIQTFELTYSSSSEKAMASHSSTPAWKIPWTEEPGWLQSMGVTKSRIRLSDFTFTFHFHALEKEMASHSSVLAWSIPGTGEPGGLPSMGSHRVGHDWSDLAVFFLFLFIPVYTLSANYIPLKLFLGPSFPSHVQGKFSSPSLGFCDD